MDYKTIHNQHHHFGWDNQLVPVLEVEPDTVLEFEVLEASGGRIQPHSPVTDVLNLDPAYANPVTGPIRIIGAEPGDRLTVEIIEFGLSGWGWTALIPQFGLLAADFPDPYLHISEYNAQRVVFTPEIHVPTRPFTGTIGLAPAAPGRHSAIPPHTAGGNMDLPDVVAGGRLHLPVQVSGALFSVGDTHAAQGDGEVCGTAIESPLRVILRFSLKKGEAPDTPRLELPERSARPSRKRGYYVTTGIAADLLQASRDAVRQMIDYLGKNYGLSPELAYCLCSIAVDLHISELVNAPNWVVSAYLPLDIFV